MSLFTIKTFGRKKRAQFKIPAFYFNHFRLYFYDKVTIRGGFWSIRQGQKRFGHPAIFSEHLNPKRGIIFFIFIFFLSLEPLRRPQFSYNFKPEKSSGRDSFSLDP